MQTDVRNLLHTLELWIGAKFPLTDPRPAFQMLILTTWSLDIFGTRELACYVGRGIGFPVSASGLHWCALILSSEFSSALRYGDEPTWRRNRFDSLGNCDSRLHQWLLPTDHWSPCQWQQSRWYCSRFISNSCAYLWCSFSCKGWSWRRKHPYRGLDGVISRRTTRFLYLGKVIMIPWYQYTPTNYKLRSVHNVPIERLWVNVTAQVGATWSFFTALELRYGLDINNVHHIWLVHYLFLSLINQQLQFFAEAWNQHKLQIRNGPNRSPANLFGFNMIVHGIRV